MSSFIYKIILNWWNLALQLQLLRAVRFSRTLVIMYQFPNRPIVQHGYQQCSFFGPSVTIAEPAVSSQRPEPDSVTSHAPLDSQLKVNSSPDDGAPPNKGAGVRGAKTGAVDTSSFSIEQRVVAAVWVHERHHTRTSMPQVGATLMIFII